MKKISVIIILQINCLQSMAQPGACLPPTINYSMNCVDDSVQLSATAGYDSYLYPAMGLSDATIANPMALNDTSMTYSVVTTSIGPELVFNGTFSAGNVGFTNGYLYTASYSPCNYYVAPTYFGPGYGYSFPDHTTATSDNNFMSIDGCSPASILWEQTIPAIDPLTMYDLSFWATRAGAIQPIFEMHLIGNVTGDVIVATQTGIAALSSAFIWDEYGFPNWNSGANTTVTIRIVNLETNVYGVDFAMDDISFRKECIDTVSIDLADTQLHAAYNIATGCSGTPVVFTDVSTPNPIASWQWNFDDGSTSITQNPQHIFTTPGTYNVELLITDNHGCQDSISQIVSVNETPAANFNFTNDCDYNLIAFTDFSTISTGSINQWYWNFGDGHSATAQNPQHHFSSAGIYLVTLSVTTANGCIDSITQLVLVKQAPFVDFNFLAACYTNVVDFSEILISPHDPISQWNWNFGDGSTSTGTNPQHYFSGVGSQQVTLSITTIAGCQDSITHTVIVPETPVADFSFTDDCYYNAALLNDLSTISTGSITQWNWNFGDGSSGVTQNATHVYGTSGSYMVQLTVTSDASCSDTVTHVINRLEAPTADFSSITAGCEDICIPFHDLSTFSISPIISWEWNFSNGQIFTTTDPVPCFTNASNHIDGYDVSLLVTNAFGCEHLLLIPYYLQIYPGPTASFTFTPVVPDVVHSHVYFTNTSQFADSYTWNFGDAEETSHATHPDHLYEEIPAEYVVTLTASSFNGSCTNTIQTIVTIIDNPLFYIPNAFTPNGDALNAVFLPVFTAGTDPFDFHFVIYDRWGEIVFESYNESIGWNGTYANNGLVQDGLYVWSVQYKDTVAGKRNQVSGHVTVLK